MVGIVIVTHRNLGAALLQAAQFVLHSPMEKAVALSVDLNDPVEKLRKDISRAIREVDDKQGVLLLTDMFGGTPSNLGVSFMAQGKVEVLSGVNLPMLVRAASLREEKDLASLALDLMDYGRQSICLASDILLGNKSRNAN
ncbi:MAG: PTS fructose transporter subunit IIA [Thermodesulfobacteriota bacterium]